MNEETKSARFALGPALLLVVALVFFEFTAFDLPQVAGHVAAAVERSLATDAGDLARASAPFRSRVLWAADVLLFLAAAAAASLLACTLLGELRSARARRSLVTIAAGLLLLEVIAGLSGLAPAFRSMFAFTAGSLRAYAAPADRVRVELVIQSAFVVNFVVALVSALGLVAGSTLASRPQATGAAAFDDGARRSRRLDLMLHLGSAMLATGVLHQFLWLRLPADLVGADEGAAAAITSYASTVTLFWGAAYSALLAAWYLPASRAIIANTREAAERARAEIDGEPEELMRKRGLVESPLQRLPQFAALLAPVVAGPLGGILADLAKAIG